MTPIIITSVALVMFFLVLLVSAIVLFVNMARKKQKLKRDLTLVIVLTVVFFSLIALDIHWVSSSFEYNKAKLKEISLDAAETSGEGLVVTYDAAKKKWDERSVEKLKNIDITISKCTEQMNVDKKTYEVKIIFDNKNSNAESMSLDEMIGLNYLMFCDKNDIVHGIDDRKQETAGLPTGKSEATLIVNVEKDVELTYLRFVDRKFPLK